MLLETYYPINQDPKPSRRPAMTSIQMGVPDSVVKRTLPVCPVRGRPRTNSIGNAVRAVSNAHHHRRNNLAIGPHVLNTHIISISTSMNITSLSWVIESWGTESGSCLILSFRTLVSLGLMERSSLLLPGEVCWTSLTFWGCFSWSLTLRFCNAWAWAWS